MSQHIVGAMPIAQLEKNKIKAGYKKNIEHDMYYQREITLMPYLCSHFYVDIKFGNKLYPKEKKRAWPLLF